MAAAITETQELNLDASEAKKLAEALENVRRFYPLMVSEKTMAWLALIGVAGGIYGSRVVTIYHKQNMRSKLHVLSSPKTSVPREVKTASDAERLKQDTAAPPKSKPSLEDRFNHGEVTPSELWPEAAGAYQFDA